jgi:hypothetical protein
MFKLEIETGNAEMCELEHVAGAVREIAEEIAAGTQEGPVRDANGNTVGSFELDFLSSNVDPEHAHLSELEAIGYDAETLEPLRELEDMAHRGAEDYCNVPNFDWETLEAEVREGVAELFGGAEPAGFFVNGDPRGYALKLQSGTGSLSQRDWGDFEILAPDFS